MKVGIIGLGWLGLPLAKSLLGKGHQVVGSTRSHPVDLNHERFSHFLFDPQKKRLSDVMHFNETEVAVLAFTPSKADEKTYAKDCVRVLDLIPPFSKVILLSSSSVYPEREGVFHESDYPLGSVRTNAVGYAELAISSILRERLTVIRLGGLVGPKRYPAVAMSNSGKTYASLDPVNLIHLEDAVGLIEYVITHRIWNETINGCSTEHPPKGQFYTQMARKLKISPPLFDEKKQLNRIISNDHSRELGYKYVYPDPSDFPIA